MATATADPKSGLGSLVRMTALQPSQLPLHPDLANLQQSGDRPRLSSFIEQILDEAETFMTSYLPANFTEKSASKTSAPAKAPVKLLAHELRAAGIAETWFARESLHENARAAGPADWDEFEFGLLDDHSQHEWDYTPDVFDAYRVLEWTGEGESGSIDVSNWRKVKLAIYEMAHSIPPPLNNRVFSVLVCTARHASSDRFLVVQIPVLAADVANAKYSNGKYKSSGATPQQKKDVTIGTYVSIERAELAEDGGVRWQMGTASDAKGNLPMWAQKMGVPGAVVKDVGLFVEWTQKRRNGQA